MLQQNIDFLQLFFFLNYIFSKSIYFGRQILIPLFIIVETITVLLESTHYGAKHS